jgi:hypothetical protein
MEEPSMRLIWRLKGLIDATDKIRLVVNDFVTIPGVDINAKDELDINGNNGINYTRNARTSNG